MAYREPGVYLTAQNTPRGVLTAGNMFPLIIGSGAKKLTKTIKMIRANGAEDAMPFTSVASISHIGLATTGADDWDVGTDYSFVPGTNTITWVETKGPTVGSTYYVVAVVNVMADVDEATSEVIQCKPNFCTTPDDVTGIYGPDVQENEVGTPVCPVSLGAQIALANGAPGVWVLQVNTASVTPTSAEYEATLSKYAKFIESMWRIVPMDNVTGVFDAVKAHVNICSMPDERLERTTVYGAVYASAPTDFSTVMSSVGNYAAAVANERVNIPYPDKASKVLSDGVLRDLGSQYIAAAIVGAEMAAPIEQSRTKMSIGGFYELKGVKLSRVEKNMLAEKGVMVLEQSTIGAPIVIRHQLTTDMSSVQTKETSIVAVKDYCAKTFRLACGQYIGKYNITPETITMIDGTLKGVITQLVRDKKIVRGKVSQLLQDADNPDTVIAVVSIIPPYPCNYINITMVLE